MEFKLSSAERLIQSGLGLFLVKLLRPKDLKIKDLNSPDFICGLCCCFFSVRKQSVIANTDIAPSAEAYFCRSFNYSGVGGHLARC